MLVFYLQLLAASLAFCRIVLLNLFAPPAQAKEGPSSRWILNDVGWRLDMPLSEAMNSNGTGKANLSQVLNLGRIRLCLTDYDQKNRIIITVQDARTIRDILQPVHELYEQAQRNYDHYEQWREDSIGNIGANVGPLDVIWEDDVMKEKRDVLTQGWDIGDRWFEGFTWCSRSNAWEICLGS